MLLRDADIKIPVRLGLLEFDEAGATRHGAGDSDQSAVHIAESHHRIAKHILIIQWGARFFGSPLACGDIKRATTVKGLRIF